MLLYLLKRLLLILPTVWLISSLVFLLSRIIPGTHADVAAEAMETTLGGPGRKVNQNLYLTQLRQQGLDKPLFYFALTTQAQPDTLYRVFPLQHQNLLQTLLHRYGNWPLVAAYYRSLHGMQAAARSKGYDPGLPEKIIACLAAENISDLTAMLKTIDTDNAANHPAVAQVKHNFIQMQEQAQPLNGLLPDLRWYGRHNQYHSWLAGLFKSDLGRSYRDRQPVLQKIKEAMGNTLLLLLISTFLTFLFSVELSFILCRWQKGRGIILNILYVLDSIPLFLLVLLFLTLLIGNGWLNVSAVLGNFAEDTYSPPGIGVMVKNRIQQLWLPVLCLILTGIPYITTQIYRLLQQLLNSEFIKTARAKGLSETRVLRKHAFKSTWLPLITLFTGYLPVIITGAVVIEVIFVIPGSGSLLRDSMYARDYPVVIGLVLFLAALKAFAHVLADALYFAADPRTRSHLA